MFRGTSETDEMEPDFEPELFVVVPPGSFVDTPCAMVVPVPLAATVVPLPPMPMPPVVPSGAVLPVEPEAVVVGLIGAADV